MIKAQIFLWKIIEGNTSLRAKVRVWIGFILFYSELFPTNPWCYMLQTLLGLKKYEEVMPDEEDSLYKYIKSVKDL